MKSEYARRLNKVLDYIDTHLGEDLDLGTLADEAAFSKYHFHRVFSAFMGEPLGSYIQRLRLERAACLISSRPDLTITEIGLEAGFSSSAVFSRAFRDRFDMSPSAWRAGGITDYSKKCKLQSNRYHPMSSYSKATRVESSYSVYTQQKWRVSMKTEAKTLDYDVRVEEQPEKTLAYVRHTGPYAGNEELFHSLFSRLLKWAAPRQLFKPGTTEMITIYHDSPEITEEEKLRISVCITVPADTEASGEIGKTTIPAGRYAVGEFLISAEDYGDAWNSLFAGWLPESGYQCADGPCYEVYLNDPEEHPEGKHHVAIHIPVIPL
ncbi:AraC family transcriptional regulator [Marispirochaeta sp.]|uniref:AraC family transcriptional regulator n=1 Tax=Marispirochaeta sp. TaxID=2038653 RepID=UPI0029C94557|nr:AraC family transcriptional regulator [Marispirochaeta sp.]